MPVDVSVPAHLSFSQSSNLLGEYCPASWFFSRGLGLAERPGWAQVGGSALHSATEEWDRLMVERGECVIDGQAALFHIAFDMEIARTEEQSGFDRSEWRPSGRTAARVSMSGGPNKKDESWWRQQGPEMLAYYSSWRLASPWEISLMVSDIGERWGIEVPFEVEMGGETVKGYIDRVFTLTDPQSGEQQHMVMDLKSGREPDSTAQLGTYRLGLIRQWDMDPQWGCYWLGGTGLATSFTDLRAKWPEARVDRRYATARRRQLAGEFDPKPSNLCGSCGVRDYCLEAGGEKAGSTPQPWEVGTVTLLDKRD